MDGIGFEQATAEDVAAIEALVREAYGPYVARLGVTPAPLTADYTAIVAQGRAVLARRDGQVVGLLVSALHSGYLEVENIAVAAGERGTGLGSRLLDLADDQARAAGVREVRLYTNAGMTENVAYYPRRGFRETGRRESGGFDRVFFVRTVGPRRTPQD